MTMLPFHVGHLNIKERGEKSFRLIIASRLFANSYVKTTFGKYENLHSNPETNLLCFEITSNVILFGIG